MPRIEATPFLKRKRRESRWSSDTRSRILNRFEAREQTLALQSRSIYFFLDSATQSTPCSTNRERLGSRKGSSL